MVHTISDMRTGSMILPFLFLVTTVQSQVWTQQADIPGPPIDGAFTFTINDKIYVGGGWDSKRLYVFDPTALSWTDLGYIPGVLVDRWIGIGFAMNGKGYVGFGYDGPELMNDFWEYDPTSNGWTQLADHPTSGRSGSIAFSANGKGYVGGGADDNNIYGEFYEYDRMTDSWALVASMPMGPTLFGNVFTVNDRSFVIGGDHGGTEDGQLFEFDPVNYEWIERAALPGPPRQAAVSLAIGSVGYYGGGQTQYTSGFDDLYAYDVTADLWIQANDIPGGIRGWAIGAGVLGKGYIGSGYDLDETFLSDWWSFDQVVGISEDRTPPSFTVFPTIADEFVNIMTNGEMETFMILDAAGRIVMPSIQVQGLARTNVSALAPGVYYTRPMSYGVDQTKMFVKQ